MGTAGINVYEDLCKYFGAHQFTLPFPEHAQHNHAKQQVG